MSARRPLSNTVRSRVRLGPVELRNRIVLTAHLTNFAEGGLPTERHASYYAARAAGGAGLIISEEHAVHPSDQAYEKLIQGFRPEVLPGYRRITEAVHAHGVPILAQLNHNGGQASGRYTRRPVWAPSPVPDPLFREVPKAMTTEEIAELVAAYADVAERCARGGFDGVELQASQSSVLRGFLSPELNLRTDRYGGALANRARLLVEVVEAVRASLGADRVLGVRLGRDGTPGGITLDELVATGRILATTGQVDYLSTTIGVATSTQWLITPSMGVPAGYALPVARALRDQVAPLPVLGCGRFTDLAAVERALASGDCDLVGVARGQVADPSFASGGRHRCVGCNQECVGRVGLNQRLGCLVNPQAGRESLAVPKPAPTPVPESVSKLGPLLARAGRRVLVVGGGPGGLRAAVTAAERGHRVMLYERSAELGGQLRVAARGPGRAELAYLVEDLAARCQELGVEVRTGVLVSAGLVSSLAPDAVVLATGARPEPPRWAVSQHRVAHVREVLAGEVDPSGRILLVDELGTHAATSTAEALATRGHQVEIVTPMLSVGQELGLTTDAERFLARAQRLRIVLTAERVVTGATPVAGGLRVRLLHHLLGQAEERECDWVVCAIPQRPVDELWHALKETARPVYRVGDCLAPRRASAAVSEGHRVAETL